MAARAEAAAATADRIMDAAIDVFWKLPTDRISLEEVARRAGVTVQTALDALAAEPWKWWPPCPQVSPPAFACLPTRASNSSLPWVVRGCRSNISVRALGVRAETGHLLHREQPAAVGRQLRDFIDVPRCDRTS